MKTMLLVVLVPLLAATAVSAQQSAGVLAAYQIAREGDDGFGGMVRYQYDQQPGAASLRFFAQAGYLTGFGDKAAETAEGVMVNVEADADALPIEVALLCDFPTGEALELYAGVGAGYYLMDSDGTTSVSIEGMPEYSGNWATSVDVDDDLGFLGLLGIETMVNERTSVFLEARYTYLKPDSVIRVDPPVAGVDPIVVSDDIEIGGLGFGLGIRWDW